MATTYTPNLNLGKQENKYDKFSMAVITENMDKLDGHICETDDNLSREIDMAKEAVSTGKMYFWHRLKSQSVDDVTGLVVEDGNHTQLNSDIFHIGANTKVFYNIPTGYDMYVLKYDSESRESYQGKSNKVTNARGSYVVPTEFMSVKFVKSAGGSIPESDAEKCKIYLWTDSLDRQGIIMSGNYNAVPISVNTVAKTITFSAAGSSGFASLNYGNKRYDLKGKVLDYSSIVSTYGYIYYNLKTDEFFLGGAGVSIQNGYADDLIYIGCVWKGGKYVDLNVLPYYEVNGVKRTMHDPRFIDIPNTYRMAVMGDSISTFVGYSEDSESGTVYEPEYYPSGDVTTVDKTWWELVRKGLQFPDRPAVSAISRSSYRYQPNNPETIPYGATDARITRLGANGDPTHIFLALGFNDPFKADVGTNQYTTNIETLEATKEYTYSGCAETICKIQNAYPAAKIIVIIPKTCVYGLSGTYTLERQAKTFAAIKEIAEQMGVYKIIDLRKCGINSYNATTYADGSNGIHPNAAGMKMIADYIIDQMLK